MTFKTGKEMISDLKAKPYNLPAPYKNCQFRHCDLRGQCLAEGKCHHPNQPKDNK